MSLSTAFAEELQMESATTRKMLERVPEDAFDWKPHEKSMTLGRLAGHVAELVGMFVPMVTMDAMSFGDFTPFKPASVAELLEKFDKNVADAVELLKNQSDEQLPKTWQIKSGEKVFIGMPRGAFIRWLISHIVHHRGQLSVYLRLRDVPLPSVYGPTADES
ncbi:MAG TPA: DinB family protein [Pyrinomonadaceae bacterium]|nr:DinB family protein [Pyrinomonadaceae bacterium]